jgi:shikimate dehydrogenase
MKRACVIGWPIEHSRSPAIHGYWLARYGIDGTYTKEAVRPEEVRAFLKSLAKNGFVGCNVTVPHKEVAFGLADEKDDSAMAVGAANTLWLDDGRLCASNSDTYGFMTYLGLCAPTWQRRDAPVAVLGAGGAARGIIHGFLRAGVDTVLVFNRSRARAEELARHFGPRIKICDWAERSTLSRQASVLVNATSVGMKGEGSLGINFAAFRPDCVVSDIVYVPIETSFLRAARARGLRTVDGLGMLLHQAVPGFEKWFGIRPEVGDELYQRIAADIAGPRC